MAIVREGPSGSGPSREKYGPRLVKRLAGLGSQTEELAARVVSVLEPISNRIPAVVDKESITNQKLKEEEWPTFLAELRHHTNVIDAALERISDALGRVEV